MHVQTESKPYDTINVTPMLDLAYVLLVVFILMTTATVAGIPLALPKPSAKPPAQVHETHVLRIEADGSLRLDGAARTEAQLRAELAAVRARDSGATIVVQGDPRTTYERVVAMIDLCNELGVGMNLATSRIGF
jgi:biopolymer transport protein ExbD